MVIWHSTHDATRIPEVVLSGDLVSLWIGTYPIEQGQTVWVEVNVRKPKGAADSLKQPAVWRSNDEWRNNSYWVARVGPFEEGDRVEYVVRGSVRGQEISDPNTYTFDVG